MIDFHTHPLPAREIQERQPDLLRIAPEVCVIRNNPQPPPAFLLALEAAGLERLVAEGKLVKGSRQRIFFRGV